MAGYMDTKFIVLTTNRSGSEWVISTLNSLPNVYAQGELFLPRRRKTEKRWDSDFARPRYIESKPKGLPFRPFSVFSYLNELYAQPGKVGFKLMYAQLGQYPEILPYLLKHRVHVVHLVRRNHLDVLLSYAVKASLGKAHLLSGQSTPEKLQVILETSNLTNRLERLEKFHNLARRLLKLTGLPSLEIAYEDLLRDQSNFQRIWDFLSVPPAERSAQSTLVKIRKGGHREVIINYDEVKQSLANTKFAGLLE
jgi:LPS sulfotransferase NodH